MATVIWTALALTAMVGMFAACVVVVVVGVRLLERVLAGRLGGPSA